MDLAVINDIVCLLFTYSDIVDLGIFVISDNSICVKSAFFNRSASKHLPILNNQLSPPLVKKYYM